MHASAWTDSKSQSVPIFRRKRDDGGEAQEEGQRSQYVETGSLLRFSLRDQYHWANQAQLLKADSAPSQAPPLSLVRARGPALPADPERGERRPRGGRLPAGPSPPLGPASGATTSPAS
ncbi:hypothetical protein ACRRTK_011125 [Alexandromys fortis]